MFLQISETGEEEAVNIKKVREGGIFRKNDEFYMRTPEIDSAGFIVTVKLSTGELVPVDPGSIVLYYTEGNCGVRTCEILDENYTSDKGA